MRRGLPAGGTVSRHQRISNMRWPGADICADTCRDFPATVALPGKWPLQLPHPSVMWRWPPMPHAQALAFAADMQAHW